MLTITYFVHGTTIDNEKDIATGWLPGELSPLGIEQARQLAEQVADLSFDAVFCSDLKRAVEMARLSFGDRYQVVQDKRLREANYGDLNGQPHSFKANLPDFIDKPFPGGESLRDVEARLRSFCNELKKHYDFKHVALLAHQAPQLALEVICNHKSWQQAIDQDWRKTHAYQPGWVYQLS